MKAPLFPFVVATLVVSAPAARPDTNGTPAKPLDATAPPTATSSSKNEVTITQSGDYRFVRANGLPDHVPGQFPNRGNPNTIRAQSYTFRLPLKPQTNAAPRSAQGAWFGVALNGVPFEPGTAEFWHGERAWNYEAQGGFIDLGLDANNAHVQPNGAYHYHGLPTGLMTRRGGDGKQMLLVGYAADGFPIYTSYAYRTATNAASPVRQMHSSWRLKKGERPGGPGGRYDGRFTADYEFVSGSGELDECNGRFGVTPEYPQGIYYYCITDEFPELARSWRGTPDPSFFKRGPGPGGAGSPGDRRPPGPRFPGAPPPPAR
jgi:YHYH protein